MTERIYATDAYARESTSTVVDVDRGRGLRKPSTDRTGPAPVRETDG